MHAEVTMAPGKPLTGVGPGPYTVGTTLCPSAHTGVSAPVRRRWMQGTRGWMTGTQSLSVLSQGRSCHYQRAAAGALPLPDVTLGQQRLAPLGTSRALWACPCVRLWCITSPGTFCSGRACPKGCSPLLQLFKPVFRTECAQLCSFCLHTNTLKLGSVICCAHKSERWMVSCLHDGF